MELLALVGAVISIVLAVEFFHIGYLVARLRENSRLISIQLDQMLRASGVKDPIGERRALL